MNATNKKVIKRALAVLFAVILVGGVCHAVYIDVFNKTEHSTAGADETQATYLKFSDRADSTSKWVKRGYNLNGKTVDLNAQTVDGTLINNSNDEVSSWQATINVEGYCLINNAWTGTVEIHQFVGTSSEITQTLDLRSYDLGEIELEYLYDGDLLIPLSAGDRIVYYPSQKDELQIAPHGEITMGMIFYYLDDLNLSDYSISYFYHRDFTYGPGFIVLAILVIAWLLLAAGTGVADASYRRAMREAELRNYGLSSMSSIYSVICFVDLMHDELIPVYASEKTTEAMPEGGGAKEKLRDVFMRDTKAPYRAAVLDFVNTDTLPDRLAEGSVALEYESKIYGWSKIRIFPVEEGAGRPLERVLFTIEDINDEKREIELFERHSAEADLESSTRSVFVTGLSNGMSQSVKAIDELASRIEAESNEASTRLTAIKIKNRTNVLTYLIDGTLDSSAHNDNDLRGKSEAYSLADMISDVRAIAETISSGKDLVFETEISPSTPEFLVGDRRRIERAFIGILSYVRRLASSRVKLSAYGTEHGGGAHLLLSVKTDGPGMTEKDARTLSDFLSDLKKYNAHAIDTGLEELEGVALMLLYMGSGLRMVNEPGEGLELYFELEQQVA